MKTTRSYFELFILTICIVVGTDSAADICSSKRIESLAIDYR